MRLSVLLFASLTLALTAVPAWAKKVAVEWKAMPGARGYEIRFERDGKEILQTKLEDNEWTGKLAFGVYAYQIRGVDKRGRPGAWSDFTPLVVMPNSPKPMEPSDGLKLESYRQAQSVELKWEPVEGAHAYRIEIIREDAKGAETAQTHVVEGNRLSLTMLEPGEYVWTVTAQFLPKERSLASLSGKKKWEGATSSKYDFRVIQRELEAPESLVPQGRVDPPKNGKLLLEWAAVEGAEAYEVTLEGAINRVFTTPNRRVMIPQMDAKDGAKKLKWSVRGLASVQATPLPIVPGPQSQAEIELDPFAEFVDGSGYIALSGLLSPSSYRSEVSGTRGVDQGGSVATIRLSGEYWLRPKFGMGAGIDRSQYDFGDVALVAGETKPTRMEFELYAKYRANISILSTEWFFSPKAGLAFRDYLVITNPSPSVMLNEKITTMGPTVGFDLRKQFSKRMSLGIKFAYFLPIASPQGTIVMDGHNLSNVSLGVQGLYWVSTHLGLGLGFLGETRSLDVSRDSTDGRARIETHPINLFGSLIYSFGR